MNRRWTLKIHYVLDQLLPPIVRDCGWIMRPLLHLILGDKAPIFLNFKERAMEMTHAEFSHSYRITTGILKRETDLNPECAEQVLRDLGPGNILEVGCGTGYLAERMAAENRPVTALDISISADQIPRRRRVSYLSASAEKLPFADKSFETVVCTHTLEHVRDIQKAVAELRRVCRHCLIVVVPRQRRYRYTFDLHLHFFPYPFLLVQTMKPPTSQYVCFDLKGDLYYRENIREF